MPACDNGRGCVKLDYTTCLPIAWGHGNQIFRSKEADLQVLDFHFSVFSTGCRIGHESLHDVVKVISKTHGKELKFGGVMPLLGC